MTVASEAAASLARRADSACLAAEHALMTSRPDARHAAEWERRRTHGLALLHDFELPLAVIAFAPRAVLCRNAAWERLCARGDSMLARLPAAIADEVDRVAGGADLWFPELALDADGAPSYAAMVARPLHDEGGAIAGAVLVAADTTDDVIARRLLVDADVLVWSGARPDVIDYTNSACRPYAVQLPGRDTAGTDVRLRRAGGGERWHHVWFVDEPGRWFGLARDIDAVRIAATERDELAVRERSARADAEQANRMKDQFLATVSHELRAPLTTMLLWETLLRDGGDNEMLRARALEVIRFSVQTQSRIVGDLLDVSRAISGKLYVDLRPVTVVALVEEAVLAAKPEAEGRGVQLVFDAAQDTGEVEADAPRLRQVLANLLSNAIKFTEAGGHVSVALTHHADSVTIAVTDDGRGIAPEFMPRLFEPFAQMNGERDRYAGGLGLGLTIAKQLVDLHHGVLAATSSGLGCGATFTVTLPLLPARAAKAPPLGTAAEQRLLGVHLLVVDDDSRVRDALALLLERAGATVRTADSAESARARLAQEMPDVLVCDIAMPGEDGYSFLRDLRSRGISTRAVAVTAHASEAAALRALDAGFEQHLAKPIDIERLIGCLRELAGVSAR